MTRHNADDWLLDLGPDDADSHLPPEIARKVESDPEAAAKLESELEYLDIISSRRVKLPDDLYFARTRQKILDRVIIRPSSWAAKLKTASLLLFTKPALRLIGAVVLVAVILVATYFAQPTRQPTLTVSYQPYVSLGEIYIRKVGNTKQIAGSLRQEYAELFLKSVAILGSPSSLSRSQTFGFSGK